MQCCEHVSDAEDETADGTYDFPTAVGLMSGPSAPLEVALSWCGWKVRTYELLGTPFDPPKDLRDQQVRAEAEADIALCDLVTFQMDCSTLTRSREIPLKDEAKKKVKSLPLCAAGPHL